MLYIYEYQKYAYLFEISSRDLLSCLACIVRVSFIIIIFVFFICSLPGFVCFHLSHNVSCCIYINRNIYVYTHTYACIHTVITLNVYLSLYLEFHTYKHMSIVFHMSLYNSLIGYDHVCKSVDAKICLWKCI